MGTKIRNRTVYRQVVRFKHKARIRATLEGVAESPRLCVFRSNRHLYVQLVDDLKGHTIAAASSAEAELGHVKGVRSISVAKEVGALIAKRALAKKVTSVVFDRGGYPYHGRVRALADAAREAGLKF